MRRRMSTIAVGLIGLALTGCGSGDDADDRSAATVEPTAPADGAAVQPTAAGSSTVPSADWCPVTTEQVSDVVHHPMVEGQPCSWTAPDLAGAVLEVYVGGTDALHLAGGVTAVEGVGDAAAFDVSDALVVELDGAYWSIQIINIGGGSDVVSKDAEVALAQLVVAG